MTNSPSPPATFRPALYLLALTLVAAISLAGVERWTRARIEASRVAERMAGLAALLPDGQYDNEPYRDVHYGQDQELLGSEAPLPIYRARRGSEPVAAILSVIAPNGYVDAIRMLVSIRDDGEIIGVRVVEHSETPGLGDAVEADKSDWIYSFDGRALRNANSPAWRLERDGGSFDQITGATITSRAVVDAVRDALVYFETHRDDIFAPPGDADPQ